jgi:hypothetical protein
LRAGRFCFGSSAIFPLSQLTSLRHPAAVRVPIPLVILLSILVVGGVWWHGSRDKDFLTPPSEQRLALIREKVESSAPKASPPEMPPPPPIEEAPPPPPPEEPKPVIELGDLSSPPVLQEYLEHADKGAGYFVELAALLEAQGESQRALLAWERVLDSGKPDESQTHAAISAIKRLRPTVANWKTDPKRALAITLQAGTGRKTAKKLTPILEETARELERASAGILKVTAKVTAGKDTRSASAPAPVAVWLTGPARNARSTEVLSFTVGAPEKLNDEVRQTVFQILRGFLGRKAGQCPPPALLEEEPLTEALGTHITRLHWQELGTLLNQPLESP